jgi:hypothetical protein
MVGFTFIALAVVVIGLVVLALGLAIERRSRRRTGTPPRP